LVNGGHELSMASGVTGSITGIGGVTFDGTGTTRLSGINLYAGDSLLNAGTVVGGLSAVSKAVINAGATWDLGGSNRAIAGIEGSGNIALGNNNLTVNYMVTPDNDLPINFAGVIAGNGELIKAGDGTLNLTGNNTYGGATRINGGFVAVDH